MERRDGDHSFKQSSEPARQTSNKSNRKCGAAQKPYRCRGSGGTTTSPHGRLGVGAGLGLAREGLSDEQIATTLTAQGHRSPLSDKLLVDTVTKIRLGNHVFQRPNYSHPRRVAGHLTISQLAEMLNLPQNWIHGRISRGSIRVKKDAARKCYLLPDEPSTLAKFRQFIDGQISHLNF